MVNVKFFGFLLWKKVLYFLKLRVVKVCTVMAPWQTRCKASQTTGKLLL